MKAYISGPMKGYPYSNYPEFESAKIWLIENTDYEILSPHDSPKMESYEDYMRHDIKLLCECNIIVMLPGWEASKGAMLEKRISDAIGNRTEFLKHGNDGEWVLEEDF